MPQLQAYLQKKELFSLGWGRTVDVPIRTGSLPGPQVPPARLTLVFSAGSAVRSVPEALLTDQDRVSRA